MFRKSGSLGERKPLSYAQGKATFDVANVNSEKNNRGGK